MFKQIVENGLRTGRVQIKFDSGTSIIDRIICFTDIPLRECNEHTSIYGKFGIGFKKSFVKNAGGNPARYFLDYLPGQTLTEASVESRGGLYSVLCNQHKLVLKLQDLLSSNPEFGLFDAAGNFNLTAAALREQIQAMIFILSFEKEMGDLGQPGMRQKKLTSTTRSASGGLSHPH